MKLISLFLFFVFILGTNAEFDAMAAEHNCKTLGDNLYNCTAFECDTPWPDDKTKTAHNKISGYNKDGDCVHEQTNPSGDKVVCKYSEESRKFLALRMKKASSDLLNIPTASDFEENILADIFHNECDIISKNGDDKPKVDDSEDNLDENDDDSEGGADTPAPDANAGTMDDDSDEAGKTATPKIDEIDYDGDLTDDSKKKK